MNSVLPPARAAAATGLPTVFVLALTLALVPAMGVAHEEMLQDTLKSMLVALGTLMAALAYVWPLRNRTHTVLWHDLLWLPLLLALYGLGSMGWSHTYLAAAETLRWGVLSLLLWLGLQTFTPTRLPLLASGIHLGAVIASLWTALQFWFDFGLFPQGPNPASTFVNRNFFAEFVVCTLPFAALLLVRAQTPWQIARLSFSSAFCVVAVLMTGTRSALVALAVLALLLPAALYACRAPLPPGQWSGARRALALGVFLATVLGLGQIASGNARINAEAGQVVNALQRGSARAVSVARAAEYASGSMSTRIAMWQATVRMIAHKPWSGVGAGAWEVEIGRYQPPGDLVEPDYYAHNEFLQLLAEYGVAGWLFLLGLFAYLGRATWHTCRDTGAGAGEDAPGRAVALASLLALLIVSGAGFPWHLAGTGALLALALGVLAASDARRGRSPLFKVRRVSFAPAHWRALGASLLLSLGLAAFISSQAAVCEQKIIRAVSMAMTISRSPNPQHPGWNAAKAQLLQLMREGVAINPHYRKITPILGDELAAWGDWRNAIWVWESVLASRPNVSALLTNTARAYLELDEPVAARRAFERAQALQPQANAVRRLEVVLLYREDRKGEAWRAVQALLVQPVYDLEVLDIAIELGEHAGDAQLVRRARAWRPQHVPLDTDQMSANKG